MNQLMKRSIWFILVFVYTSTVAAEILPVDISLLMVEIKYNEERGIQVCEFQPVSQSLFNGYDHIYNGTGLIGRNICEFLSQFGSSFWFIKKDITHDTIRNQFLEHGWKEVSNRAEIVRSNDFLRNATKIPKDPKNIFDYSEILYLQPAHIHDFDRFRKNFPSAIIIDEANMHYTNDKYKMSLLFRDVPRLEAAKPRWNLYQGPYNPQLADQIIQEIQSEILVIKPRVGSMGRGVIMVHKEELDETLQLILNPTKELANHPERGYNYWGKTRANTFLVEEFISSDLMRVSDLNNQLFDPTMRLAVALIHSEGTFHLHFLGEYWNVPDKSVEEDGTLIEKHAKAAISFHARKVDDETRKRIHRLITKPLIVLYKRMLGFPLDQLEKGLESAFVSECQLE